MHSTGKQSVKSKKPSPSPTTAPGEPGRLPRTQEMGEGSYGGTRDYQTGLRSYLKSANVEKDAYNAAPGSAAEARDMEKAEEAGRRHDTKAQKKRKRQIGAFSIAIQTNGATLRLRASRCLAVSAN